MTDAEVVDSLRRCDMVPPANVWCGRAPCQRSPVKTAASSLPRRASSMVGGGSRPTQDTGMSLELESPDVCRCADGLLPSPEPPPSSRPRAATTTRTVQQGLGSGCLSRERRANQQCLTTAGV